MMRLLIHCVCVLAMWVSIRPLPAQDNLEKFMGFYELSPERTV